MIDVFNGRRRGVYGQSSLSYVQLSHHMRSHLYLFTPSSWMVLTCLMLHANEQGECWPGIASISKETGLTTTTVQSALKYLCDVKIQGYDVLSCSSRYTQTGRQTSNVYTIFPDREGEIFIPLEGSKKQPPHYIEEDTERSTPLSPPKKARKQTQLPNDDDPAKWLYTAYRQSLGMDPEFTVGEWQGVHICLRQMCHHGVTVEDIAMRAKALVKKWGKPHMVTVHALWKHWGSAVPAQDTGDRAAMILDFIQGLD